MGSFDKIPKLMYKKNWDEYNKRDKKDSLTSEDMDDWLEAFEWILDTCKEVNKPKDKKDI